MTSNSKGTVIIEMPQEAVWATGRHSGSPDDDTRSASDPDSPPRQPAAQRLLLRLLRLCAQTGGGGGGGGGGGELLHVSLAVVLSTVAAGFTLVLQFQSAMAQLSLGRSVFTALVKSSIFGLMYLLMWVALMFCFATSRRRFGRLLISMGRCLSHVTDVTGHPHTDRLFRREVSWLLAAAAGMMVMTATVAAYMILIGNCETLSKCVIWQSYGVVFDIFHVSFMLIPIKFVFVGLQVNAGFRAIQTVLKDSASDRKSQLDGIVLEQLLSLQDDLAQLFTSLTEALSCELITIMAYGTVANVCMWLLPIVSVREFDVTAFGPMLLLYMLGASVTIVLPCELVQRLLKTLGRTRDLLLAAERRQPPLGPQLSLFRETVNRDLERLGDLGLFRLQRSTILSISATILTYIIVMLQFLQA